jgi:phospho-N-acetylmuramoyl-pentapeptide-transferase
LIAAMASVLMCLFLSPKFIAFRRRRWFGQNISEEGDASTPPVQGRNPIGGGIIVFLAIAIPYVLRSMRGLRSIGVFVAAIDCAPLGFADGKIVKRRSPGLRRGRSSLSPVSSRSPCVIVT